LAAALPDCLENFGDEVESDRVGDDPAFEMRMANQVGAVSEGVATGLNSLEILRRGTGRCWRSGRSRRCWK
jgi:hypothetical protein